MSKDTNKTVNNDDLNQFEFDVDWNQLSANIINNKTNKSGGSFSKEDDRIWKPSYDKEGIYYFYFLIAKDKRATASFNTHSIKYFENGKQSTLYGVCPKSAKQPCPLCEHGWKVYNDDNASKLEKTEARTFLPQENEYCNILITKDPNNPENNGKVFLYKISKTVKKLITERIQPGELNLSDCEFVPFIPFDFKRTALFKLHVTLDQKDKTRCNYDKSKFMASKESDLHTINNVSSGAEIKKLIDQTYNLTEIVDEYIKEKIISPDRYSKDTKIGKMIFSGEGSGMNESYNMASNNTYDKHSNTTDANEPINNVSKNKITQADDDISDEEKEFLNDISM